MLALPLIDCSPSFLWQLEAEHISSDRPRISSVLPCYWNYTGFMCLTVASFWQCDSLREFHMLITHVLVLHRWYRRVCMSCLVRTGADEVVVSCCCWIKTCQERGNATKKKKWSCSTNNSSRSCSVCSVLWPEPERDYRHTHAHKYIYRPCTQNPVHSRTCLSSPRCAEQSTADTKLQQMSCEWRVGWVNERLQGGMNEWMNERQRNR